ncbi:MAG: hypothetical protein MSS77_04695 [Mollicutes bacterium]|nr:hypothetical protein [Mollicutes bacterium]
MGLKKYVENPNTVENETEKKDVQVEEEIVEEVNADEIAEETSEEIVEEPLSNRENEMTKTINEERTNYKDFYKKQRKVNTIVTVSILVVVLGAFLMVIFNDQMGGVGIYVAIGLFVVAIVVSFLTSRAMKNKLTARAQEYVKSLYEITNAYVFDDKDISNLDDLGSEQLPTQEFIDGHFYKNIKATRNRNFVKMLYKSKELLTCDLAASILIKGKTSPMFLGKFYKFPCSYSKENSVILYQLKGGELSRPLDDVDDLKLVDGNKKYNVYSNDDNYKKILTDRILSLLNSFKIDDQLIDVIVSIKKGVVILGIDYSDEFMNIPVESEYNVKNTLRVKKDFERVKKIFDLLNK